VVIPTEEPEAKSNNSALLVVAIVVPVVVVVVVAVVLIACLLKRNRKAPYEGVCIVYINFMIFYKYSVKENSARKSETSSLYEYY
jgi:flagellar basal body-associated protein FliL